MSRGLLTVTKFLALTSLAVASSVMFSMPEHSPPGSLVGDIPTAISLHQVVSEASLPYMKYSFLSAETSVRKYFSLQDKTGQLRLSQTEVLDRETVCPYTATCLLTLQVAIQSTHTQFFRKVLVNVDVLDINDHAPEFRENHTLLAISESVQIPASFPLPSALDNDTGANNSLQGYEMFPKDSSFELVYSQNNPNLLLRLTSELDHETRSSYSFTIVARDGGSPPRQGVLTVDVVVEDVNDNAPQFTQKNYAKVVDESLSPGALLMSLTATDADSGKNGQVRYRFSPQQPATVSSMFTIDELKGDLRLLGDLQDADVELYTIEVEATDQSDQPLTNKATVSIQVQDTINSRPRLLLSYLSIDNYSSISEFANLGVAVAHILVKDTDRGPNGIVQCSLQAQGFFELQNFDVKEYNVIVAKSLDRESAPVHNVTVECADAGMPSLSVYETFLVKVIDENDNAPEFTQRVYHTILQENNDVDKQILQVTAVDKDDPSTGNGRVTYRLENIPSGEFLINSQTGVVKAAVSFDYEVKRQINFTVLAEDDGNPKRSSRALISVSIQDENDQVPYFTQNQFSIVVSEYASPGGLIGEIKAMDTEEGKNGFLDFSLISGSGKGRKNPRNNSLVSGSSKARQGDDFEVIDDQSFPFKVHSNGSIFLAEKIDHEIRDSYEFQVRVSDQGMPPLSDATVVVVSVKDENDNAPQILHPNASELSFLVLPGSEASTTLLAMDTVDLDSGRNGLLVYTVSARNDSGRFLVDNEGKVRLSRELGNRDAGTYKLTVVVMDSGVPPLSDVRTFYIHVAAGNHTDADTGILADQYMIITLTLVCTTILLSVIVVLVMVIIRRLDTRRKNLASCSQAASFNIRNSKVVAATVVERAKVDNLRNENKEVKKGQGRTLADQSEELYGFSSSGGGTLSCNVDWGSTRPASEKLPMCAWADGGVDTRSVQLQPVLYPLKHNPKTCPEDGGSQTSGDSTTSDSGRGGSDEDSGMCDLIDCLGDNTREVNLPDKEAAGQPRSHAQSQTRSSQRKHVTFQDVQLLTSFQHQGQTPLDTPPTGARISGVTGVGTQSARGHQIPPNQSMNSTHVQDISYCDIRNTTGRRSSNSSNISSSNSSNISSSTLPRYSGNGNSHDCLQRTASPRLASPGLYHHHENSFGQEDALLLQTFTPLPAHQKLIQRDNTIPSFSTSGSNYSPVNKTEWNGSPVSNSKDSNILNSYYPSSQRV